jgi:hypothetical protein
MSSTVLPLGARVRVHGHFLMVDDARGCVSVPWAMPYAWLVALTDAWERFRELGEGQAPSSREDAPAAILSAATGDR